MKKFIKNHFAIKENTINAKLTSIIEEQHFKIEEGKLTKELQILSDDLLKFYALCFCKGSVSSARNLLDTQYNEIRRKDSNLISFFLGAIFLSLIMLIFLLAIRPSDGVDHWSEIGDAVDIYYFTGVISFIVFSTGFAV